MSALTAAATATRRELARLVEGMPVQEAIRRMAGIRCGFKTTSCPDQLAKALQAALEEAAQSTADAAAK